MVKKIANYLLLLIVICSTNSNAENADLASQYLVELDAILENPLPNIEQVLPGYTRPEKNQTVPGLIIGVFSTEPGDSLDWGFLLSEILRIRLYSLPTTEFDLVSINWNLLDYDARPANGDPYATLRTLESLQILGKRYNIHYGLTGSIKKNNDNFSIKLKIIDLSNEQKTVRQKQFISEFNELPQTISEILAWIYASYNLNDEKDLLAVQRVGPENPVLLESFAAILGNIHKNKKVDMPNSFLDTLKDEKFFPTARVYQILAQAYDTNIFDHNESISTIAKHHPDFHAIDSVAAYEFWHDARTELVNKKINKFQKLIARYPHEQQGFLLFSVTLAKFGSQDKAVTLAREQLIRWPDRYRSWWQLAYNIKQLAWFYRGQRVYSDVSTKGKRVFEPLLDLAQETIDVAIKMNPTAGQLYGDKVGMYNGYYDEMFNTFKSAIKYEPKAFYIYESALNFAAPKWGGSVAKQVEIYEAAEANGLDSERLKTLWAHFIEKPNPYHPSVILKKIGYNGLYNKEIVVAVVILFCIAILYFIRGFFIHNKKNKSIAFAADTIWQEIMNYRDALENKDINLIAQKNENSFVFPQLDQSYYLLLEDDELKIKSHFGVIEGNITVATKTMLEVIKSGVKQVLE